MSTDPGATAALRALHRRHAPPYGCIVRGETSRAAPSIVGSGFHAVCGIQFPCKRPAKGKHPRQHILCARGPGAVGRATAGGARDRQRTPWRRLTLPAYDNAHKMAAAIPQSGRDSNTPFMRPQAAPAIAWIEPDLGRCCGAVASDYPPLYDPTSIFAVGHTVITPSACLEGASAPSLRPPRNRCRRSSRRLATKSWPYSRQR